MIEPARSEESSDLSPSANGESLLEDLIEDCTNRLQAGEDVDLEGLAVRHPDVAERLRQLLPSLRMMAEVGRATTAPASAALPAGIAIESTRDGSFELGDYRVLRMVGRGGMGIVYEALQLSLNRRVALKVLPFAASLDSRQLRRFQIEAQAAAQLHHTSIVPVFSVGCERGVHFYAMQFIEGRTLAELIQERREASRAAEGPVGRSPDRGFLRSVARLGIQAAEALDHAHRQGIIHRDIKPANLLVDARGDLWTTDFGLARFVNEAGLTVTGDLVGTLRYMSPEQALARRLVLDHRTDIYSLGATLYELLTLRPAVDGRDRQDVLRRIAQGEPAPPRRIDPTIPRDLETILLKAMAREPEDRYATAQELADDLRRFLEHRTIKARRPTLREQVLKLGRRHVGLVVAAMVVLFLAVGGLVASLILIGRERELARRRAEEATAHARRARDHFSWFLQGLTEPLKRMANPELARNPDYVAMRKEVVSEAIRAYEGFLSSEVGERQKARTIDTWIHIALLHTVADNHDQAQDSYRRAIAIAEQAALAGGGAGDFHVGQTHAHLGMELWDVGRPAEGRLHFRAAIGAFRRALERQPDDVHSLQSSAWFLSLFQDPAYRDPDQALDCARRLVALTSEKGHNRRSYSAGIRPLFTLGLAENRQGNLDAARRTLERSIELREGGDAYEWFVLAMVLARQGDVQKARKLHGEAVRWMRTYRYSDFELHALDAEAAALLDSPGAPALPTEPPDRH